MKSRFAKIATIVSVVIALAFVAGCAKGGRPEDVGRAVTLDQKPLEDPPSYGQLASSLEHWEKELGVKFYRNSKGYFQPYSVSNWNSFTIADDLNECLFEVQMKGLVTYRHMGGGVRAAIDMEIHRGPCGIKAPYAEIEAIDAVNLMESTVITPSLMDQVNSISLCTGTKFIQRNMSVPWRVDSIPGGLEQAVGKIGYEVKNPLDITFGDIVFFTEYYGERNVGIYVDYGNMVYNSCFRAKVRRMDSKINYRVYRLYTGFNLVEYKLHENKFIEGFVGGPQ